MAHIESQRDCSHVERYRPDRSTRSSSVADILERVLDKGIVITGDIKINLTDVELLTIQVRLIVCSVERAERIGLDWWKTNPAFSSLARQGIPPAAASQETVDARAEAPQPETA